MLFAGHVLLWCKWLAKLHGSQLDPAEVLIPAMEVNSLQFGHLSNTGEQNVLAENPSN